MNSRQETPPLLPAGPSPASPQELANRRGRDAEPERAELARDPLIAPAGILAREAEDERARLGADRVYAPPHAGSSRHGPLFVSVSEVVESHDSIERHEEGRASDREERGPAHPE